MVILIGICLDLVIFDGIYLDLTGIYWFLMGFTGIFSRAFWRWSSFFEYGDYFYKGFWHGELVVIYINIYIYNGDILWV